MPLLFDEDGAQLCNRKQTPHDQHIGHLNRIPLCLFYTYIAKNNRPVSGTLKDDSEPIRKYEAAAAPT